jgi:hypothetical protein
MLPYRVVLADRNQHLKYLQYRDRTLLIPSEMDWTFGPGPHVTYRFADADHALLFVVSVRVAMDFTTVVEMDPPPKKYDDDEIFV